MVGGRSITPKVNTRNLMSSDRAYQNVAIHLDYIHFCLYAANI